MRELPRNRQDMIELFLEATAVGGVGEDINEEHLALLVEGRVDELSPADRERLLRQVATDDEAGRLLADLQQIGLGEAPAPPGSQLARMLKAVVVGWAIAACLVVGLSVWRSADPPVRVGPGGVVQTFSADDGRVDYWSQVDRQRLQRRANRDRWRDYALAGSVASCVVLSAALVLCMIDRHRKPRMQS